MPAPAGLSSGAERLTAVCFQSLNRNSYLYGTRELDYDLSPSAPGWVDFAPNSVRGLDLLGLRLPVQAIGLSLLDAVTTISPKVRYLSFRTFIADAYRTAPGPPPDSYSAFMSFAVPAETAFALGNALVEPEATNIVGIDGASKLLEAESGPITFKKLVDQPALNAYARPAEILGLVGTRDGAPWVGKDLGLRIAQLLRGSWGSTALGRRLLRGETLDSAHREDLKEFGEACSVNKLLDQERQLLIDAIIPAIPKRDAVERVRTCALLLYLSRNRNTEGASGLLTEAALMRAARQPRQAFPEVLRHSLDGWLIYQVRDCLAVVHEAALGEVVSFLNSEGRSPGGRLGSEVIGELLSYGSVFSRLWTDLGFPGTLGSLRNIRIADLASMIAEACSDEVEELEGLRRWSGQFDEWKLIEACRGYGSGVLLMLPLAWLLSDRRAGRGVREKGSLFERLSLGGSFRVGMRQVVLPRLERLMDRNPTLDEAIGELVALTVTQHTQVALSRLAQDPRRDVALLRMEGDRWIGLRDYAPGRTASRLPEAIGWLRQLELISESGLTEEGETILDRALDSLKETTPR